MELIISFIVSGVSLVLSVLNFVISAINRRRKINISILEYSFSNGENQFLISFENCSQLPVSISRIFLHIDGEKYECALIPRTVRKITHYSNSTSETEEIKTLPFPVYLGSLGCASGYVAFPKCPKGFENNETHVIFELYTNRGKIKSLKALLTEECRLRKRS